MVGGSCLTIVKLTVLFLAAECVDYLTSAFVNGRVALSGTGRDLKLL